MKKIVLIIVILSVSHWVHAQNVQDSAYDFLVENGKIYWKHAYSTLLTKKECMDSLERKGIFTNPKRESNILSGDLKEADIDFNGLRPIMQPMKLAQSKMIGHAIIDFSNKEYHILLTDILFVQMFDWRLRHKGSHAKLEDYTLNNKQSFYKSVKPSGLKILDYTFKKLFAL